MRAAKRQFAVQAPTRYGPQRIMDSCDLHDECYQKCDTPKNQCDDAFLSAMNTDCLSLVLRPLAYNLCLSLALTYATGVRNYGQDAWIGQRSACQCCTTCPACTAGNPTTGTCDPVALVCPPETHCCAFIIPNVGAQGVCCPTFTICTGDFNLPVCCAIIKCQLAII